MNIWAYSQLSPVIAAWIKRTLDGIKAESLCTLGRRDATNPGIFEEARKANAVVVSKYDDFIQLVEQKITPPQLI